MKYKSRCDMIFIVLIFFKFQYFTGKPQSWDRYEFVLDLLCYKY